MKHARELISETQEFTGLSDFGAGNFFPALEVLTETVRNEGKLNDTGRFVAHAHLLGLLQNRLRIEDWYQKHPEIEHQPVTKPIFIIRLARDRHDRCFRTYGPRPPSALAPRVETRQSRSSTRPSGARQRSTHRQDPRANGSHARSVSPSRTNVRCRSH